MADYRPYGLAPDENRSSLFAGRAPLQDRSSNDSPNPSSLAGIAAPGIEGPAVEPRTRSRR